MLVNEKVQSLQALVKNPDTFSRVEDIHPRMHAKFLDKALGYKIAKIEVKLLQKYRAYYKDNDESNKKQHYHGTQTWIGLHPQALQTPYNDIYDALSLLSEFEVTKVVDIGAGYGRVGLVMNSIFPDARFIGYEILKQRELEANRVFEKLNLLNCEVIRENVLEQGFRLPSAEVYFIYDFSDLNDLTEILDVLESRIEEDSFFLIVKGDMINYLMTKKYKKFWRKNGFINTGELKIYSSKVNLELIN